MKITVQILFIFVLTFALGAMTIAAQSKRPKIKTSKTAKTVKPKIVDKIVYEPDADLLKETGEKVSVVEANNDWAQFNRQRPINNSSGTWTAYIAQYPLKSADAPENTLFDVIVVHDTKNDKFYKIQGFDDFNWRPFSEIKWTSADVLQFEQWVNPHNGGRYSVNVKTGKLVAAGYVRSN